MLGLFGSIDMAARALSAYQQATSVAGNNLANVNNPAYARQKLNIQSSTSLTTNIGQEGTGVDAIAITQIRNSYLDGQIASEGGIASSLSVQQQALQQAEAQLSEQITNGSDSTATSANGLNAKLSTLFANLQKLTNNPSDTTLRQTVIQSAQNLTNQFNQISKGLTSIRTGLNASISNDVDAANKDLSAIADLNKQITLASIGGGSANDLLDQRQLKLEDLSKYTSYTATTQTNGAIDISIGGASLVAGGSATNKLVSYDAGGGQVLVGNTGSPGQLSITSGSISGEITVRDGGLYTLQSSLDSLASQIVTQFIAVYSAGYDLSGNTGGTFFTGNSAATLGVNSAVVANPTTFQASGTAGAAGDNSVAKALAALATTSFSTLSNQSFTGNYSSTVAALGSAIASSIDDLNSTNVVSKMLTQQRDSISGVNTDEELTNLTLFQKAYEASAKLVSTLNAMLDTVIHMKN